VVAVIINHFNKDLLPSGYLGVDIFFVISGYVITSSLAERESKNFLDFLTGFYERRIKRLVPALVVFVLITSVLICLFNPTPGTALGIGWRSLFGISNIILYQQSSDYFAQSFELNPVVHTWSLGVEEQFYLLFPFLIWFTGFAQQTAKGARNLFTWVGALTIASLIGFIYLYQINQPAAYFLMPPRFWEMAAGCLLFIGFQKRARIEQALEQIPPLLVVAAMVGVMFLPVAAAVPATIGIVVLSAVLIACLKQGTAAYKFFTLEKVVYIGLISYSLYLWHWSVLSISRWTIGIHWWSVPIQVGLMLLLAVGSYQFVELRFNKSNPSLPRWQIIGLGVFTSLGVSAIILIPGRKFSKNLFLGQNKSTLDEISQLAEGTSLNDENCSVMNIDTFRRCSIRPKKTYGKRILLMGDSHSSQYFPLLGKLRNKTGVGISGFVTSGQPFPEARYTHKGLTKDTWEKYNQYSKKFFKEEFKKLGAGDTIILSSRLEYYFISIKYNKEHKQTKLFLADKKGHIIDEENAFSLWLKEVSKIAKESIKKGVKVIVFAPIPVFANETVDLSLCQKEWFRNVSHETCGPGRMLSEIQSQQVNRYKNINNKLDQLVKQNSNIRIYKPFNVLCPPHLKYCGTFLNGIRTYRDNDHLFRDGALLVESDFFRFALNENIVNH